MRDSVPLFPRFPLDNLRRLASSLPLASLSAVSVLAFALAGCSGKTKGQVILALQTDMSMPEDISRVKIEVKADGASRYDRTFVIDPNVPDAEKIPATLSVVAGEKDNETIELKVIGLRAGTGSMGLEPRTLNKTITTIPTERISLLRVPMQWLCTDEVTEIDDGEYESNCNPANGKETSCVAGGCKDVHLDSSHLPDFEADAVFGGSDEPGSGGQCFPTEECFDVGADLYPDADCVVSFEPESDEIINFAVLAVNGGICSGPHCYVGLDKSRDFGWYELEDGEPPAGASGADAPLRAPLGRRFQLPQGVCDRIADGRAVGVRVSTDDVCEVTKTPKFPTCGPWSSVGKKPAGADADGDGVDGEDSGGTDCDDSDNSVYPGALEACDEVDNDCNMLVDDNCVADLPLSHRVDFSALDGFTSDANYAIYQAFDATKTLDLDHRTVTFVPNANHTSYTVSAGALEWDDDLGELVPILSGQEDVSSCDDCFSSVPLEFAFDFFGTEYTTAFPSSNGYLTFGVGDETYSESVEEFLASAPRISAFWDDLDTRGTPGTIDDEVHYFSDASKLVVTYQNIQIYSGSGTSNTFQLVLLSDGTIKISYDGMDDLDESSLVGITPGSLNGGVDCGTTLTNCFGSCANLQNDATNCGACGTACVSGEFCLSGECVVVGTTCSVSNAPCDGTCVGYCAPDAPAQCEGTCYGTCSGTCSGPDGAGGCAGACDGLCDGQCYLDTGGQCPDACSGTCYIEGTTCPTPPGMKPCTFVQGALDAGISCADTAQDAIGNTYQISCSADLCQCCVNSTCTDLTDTPAGVCRSTTILRDTLVGACMTDAACGDTCPATAPQTGAACDETELSACYYNDNNYCYCSTAQFSCSAT